MSHFHRETSVRGLRFSTLTILICAAVFCIAICQAVCASQTNGWVNWDRQVIKAIGHGVAPKGVDDPAQAKLMTRAAAVADAYRNLAMVVNGVKVDGKTSVKNYVAESDEVRLRVQGMIRGADIVSEKQGIDGTYEIVLQLPMTGANGLVSGLSLVLPDCNKMAESTGEIDVSKPSDTKPSGLIIDARGIGASPAISPKIYDEDGKEVYGTLQVSPDAAIEVGIAGFPKSMAEAMKSTRTGADPLVIKALRRGEKYATDVVVSNADASKIREADARTNILPQCRVSIVLQ